MMDAEVRITITHCPNGDEDGRVCLQLMPDGSVIGNPFGPTIIDGGKRLGDDIVFQWNQDRQDIAGILRINGKRFATITGVAYSGSSYSQEIPEYKRAAVEQWMKHFE